MKSILITILTVISFALGLTAFLWEQPALAIIFSIILPIIALYFLISPRYKDQEKNSHRKHKKDPVDNYFHPVEK